MNNPTATKIIHVCEVVWQAHKSDCSGFVKAVAAPLGVHLQGMADNIVDQIAASDWTQLADGVEAKAKADLGWFVIGAMKGANHVPPQSHGHVVVVVTGPLVDNKYPTAYWGQLGGVGMRNASLNYAWNPQSRDEVRYAAIQIQA